VFDQYFEGHEVRAEFKREFISLWPGWLGPAQSHKLDEVTESEWQRFNDLLSLVVKRYRVLLVDLELSQLKDMDDADAISQPYQAAMNKDASQFIRLVIPELGCVLAEDWDYTYILWHNDGAAVAALAPLVEKAGLHHFGLKAA
jgi:hypothetical protein